MIRRTFACLLLLCIATAVTAATHRVPADYPTIQAGIDACSNGDTVLVEPGTYIGEGNVELAFNGIDCSVIGEGGPTVTTIDCEQASRGFALNHDGSSTGAIAGLTITGAVYVFDSGGAIVTQGDTLEIFDVQFRDNSSGFGGGLSVSEGNLKLRNCLFEGNHASYDGGGIVASIGSTVEITDCQFIANTASTIGGAIMAGGADSVIIRDCTFDSNVGGAIGGGAVVVGSHSVVENAMFNSNVSLWDGGAMLLSGSTSTTRILECVFIGNRAEGRDGGAISMGLGGASGGAAVIERCFFYGNTATWGGGAVSCSNYSTPTFRNCTFVGDSASTENGGAVALYWHSEPVLEQVVIALSPQGGGIRATEWSVPHLSCSDVWGNVDGDFLLFPDPTGTDGNISADPRFCGAQPDDFTLQADSPCAPANNTCGVLMGLYDVACDSVDVESKSWGGIKSMY
ncbi:MAG: hypothetical protein H6694_08575 [Candidatus Latescibacteria bacterium]|nr:hypothetical protein [Candidatus Latescibacterota bacterium]